MKWSAIFVVLAMLVTGCSQSSPVAEPRLGAVEAVQPDTKLAAVMVRADWCPTCKVIEPKVLAARADQQLDGVAHIVIDYTERDDRDFYAQADAAGVGRAMRREFSDGIYTGMLYVVDVDSQKIVGDARNPTTTEKITALLERKLADKLQTG